LVKIGAGKSQVMAISYDLKFNPSCR